MGDVYFAGGYPFIDVPNGGSVNGVNGFRDAFARAIDADGPVLLDIDMSALRPMGGLGSPPPAARRAQSS